MARYCLDQRRYDSLTFPNNFFFMKKLSLTVGHNDSITFSHDFFKYVFLNMPKLKKNRLDGNLLSNRLSKYHITTSLIRIIRIVSLLNLYNVSSVYSFFTVSHFPLALSSLGI